MNRWAFYSLVILDTILRYRYGSLELATFYFLAAA